MPEGFTATLIAVLGLAVLFDYINGFHDTANAIATSVSTRALSPRLAIAMSATANFVGALTGTAVAHTIGAGLITPQAEGGVVVAAALIGAIVWNLLTWRLGIPSSSSHALIGGLLGASAAAGGFGAWQIDGILGKVHPAALRIADRGFAIGFCLMVVHLPSVPARAPEDHERPIPAPAGAVGRLHGLQPWQQRRPEDDGGDDPGARLGRAS